MADRNLKALRTEVIRFGPSPFVPNKEGPMLILFHNELESVVGTAETDVFGKPASAFLIITTFRIVLYKWNKHGDDEVRSYWFHIDCSDKPFHDEEGFLIAGVETSLHEYSMDELKNKPFFTWDTSYMNPDGGKKIAESVKIYPTLYNHHHENRYVDVNKTISIPGYTPDGKESYPALMPFVVKFYAVRRGPMGRLKMIDLEVMHQSPEAATRMPAGEVPDDCELHESKATRPSTSYNVKSKIKKGTSKEKKHTRKKERQPAASEAKADPANQTLEKQSEPTTQAQTVEKEEDKKPAFKWKKMASTALDVGSKLKGGLDVIGKAASAAAASGAETIKEITEKGAETVKKAGESIRETAQETLAERAASAGSAVRICAACGAPMRSGSLFCGKCGQKIADRAVEEVKDHIKGKVEDAAVEKAKAMLDEEEKSTPTAEVDIRSKAISKSSLPANITKPLKKAGIKTLGGLADQVKADPAMLDKIKGIGPASIGKIKEAVADVPVQITPPPAVKQTKCRKCGQPVQMDWSFCPHCQEPVIKSCPQCGAEIQKEWKFCPMCTAQLE